MITINKITINEENYLTGLIGKTPYSVKETEEIKNALIAAHNQINSADTMDEANSIQEAIMEQIDQAEVSSANAGLKEILADDLYYENKSGNYFVKYEDKISTTPIQQFFVDKMKEAADKGLSPKPWLIFWVRMMRNNLYATNSGKVQQLINYLKASYVDQNNEDKLIEDGYSPDIAHQLSTFDQISITEQGILAAFKYVRLLDKKFVVEKDKETGEQTIVEVDRYERKLEVDEDTGEITKDELDLPEYAEDFRFAPPIMGNSGDAFSCRGLEEEAGVNNGHIVKVGKVHELTPGFSQVNTNDNRAGVKGLHLGGYYYVQGFGGKTDYLIDCLVAPEDIGAVADLSRSEEGAIRCRRYMVTGGHFQVSRGMYHPSKYAEMLEDEWNAAKVEAIEKLEKLAETEDNRL